MSTEFSDHNLSKKPAQIIQDLKDSFTGTKENLHRRLKMQAEITTVKQGTTVKSYMENNKSLRLQMLQVEYANIKDERTSVCMAINCSTHHTHFRTGLRELRVAGMPNTLRKIEESIME